ncbi:MAG: hypothetical protein A2600_05010 [Candidatus Lambdaproteobacteria bacterium RIFOXYD1_FULL_56_27]|uniref:Bacterial bifunctional deaminase-reductase C-terminal domain-containing protein n=1 Tax=Candidatus Lambdaproteobacteria bacterium RIFOXYD2_FULL_56_26 TaxID=1817773 RepID=A0A1F6GRQ4_9PROT|nr:MAG: hypothetical protein A2426_07865 [Candidatus Lambdaproteobacteria bacterium RIFOXYC1_FULL_56_13]OGH00822.1 MAG: hypothetical protein A2557_03875 [Candidatus Lambdaproteobacteria bacterium RIFOXYD2_FULL_56_26]OGH09913.1 MAG: hypothetical protein A2600_05010 [Candidatus Lambdaproteobacteria bacterium RIFOXYD1_FULL_56_27]
MAKVRLYIAQSLDGFIANLDGGIGWLDRFNQESGEDYGYKAFYGQIGTLLMGGNTYAQVLGFAPEYVHSDRRTLVFTSRPLPVHLGVELVTGDPVPVVRAQKAQADQDLWLVGGGQLVRTLHQAKLIDELILSLIPVTLGAGIPLFAGLAQETFWTLAQTQSFQSGIVQLVYRPLYP